MGTPFKLVAQNTEYRDLYYFRVINNDNNVIYTFRVYSMEGKFETVLSEDLVDGLNQIQPFTSKERPADIYVVQL